MTIDYTSSSANYGTHQSSGDGHPKRRPHFLEATLVGAALLGAVHMYSGGVDTAGAVIADAVRYFASTSLDRSCTADGALVERGMPCVDAGSFRFVLGREGRYSIYAVEGASAQIVAQSGDTANWMGTSEQLSSLERLAAVPQTY
jgi:hypothetical protein